MQLLAEVYLPWQLVKHIGQFLCFILLLLFWHLFNGIWHRILHVTCDWVDAGTHRWASLMCNCRIVRTLSKLTQNINQLISVCYCLIPSPVLLTHKGLADLYSSVSESSSSEYWVSPLPPARSPRATRSPAAFPYPVYFNRLSTKGWKHKRHVTLDVSVEMRQAVRIPISVVHISLRS